MPKIRIEGTRTQTIRTVLLAAFAGLAFVLLGALGWQDLRRHGFHLDLPGRLGADISQTANGFTYSQSQRGHTLFTIHASKIVQYKGNQAELHDVAITLYGPEGSHRQDRISGSNFLYEKDSGLVTARGPVEIDMASPAAGAGTGAAPPDTIHVQTSDLRFDQRSGEAQTTKALAFTLPRASGKAIGGDYNSKTGVLVLETAVELHADQNGSPSVVYAEHAQLLRDSHVAYLLRARSEYEGGQNSADTAVLQFRPDGSLEHLDAHDHVHMLSSDGAELYASTAAADFDAKSQPLGARAGGGVNFISDTPESNMHGNAVDGALQFSAGDKGKAVLRHAQFHNAVSFVVLEKSFGGDPRATSTREMTASTMDVDFAPGPDGQSLAQKAVAAGGATVNFHDLPFGAPPKHTAIHGEQLVATIADGHQIRQLDGTGGTTVTDYAPDGATDTSTGDSLHATFLPQTEAYRGGKSSSASETAAVDTAVQQGHVTMKSEPARGAKASDGSPQQPLYAEALMSTFHSADSVLHLTGDAEHPPRVHNGTLALTATLVDYHRGSGDALAEGDVRSTYLQGDLQAHDASGSQAHEKPPGLGSSGPVHVTGASATMTRNTNTATFLGDAAAPARMWQDANSVTAPVLELNKQQSSLKAHGAEGAHGAVHATFANQSSPGKGSLLPTASATSGSGTDGRAASGLTRIIADTLFYSDTTRTGDFHGNVTAQQPTGTVHSDDAQIFLAEAPAGQASRLDRMVARGHVQLLQPGRRGTGEQLVYTAGDGNYLLTGTAGDAPRASDAQKGATTGAALLFRNGDNSVEVLNNDAAGMSRRTVTDTRTPK